MAKKSNIHIIGTTLPTAIGSNNIPIGSGLTIPSVSSNTFTVNDSSGETVISVEPDGYCVIKKLALLDDVTGNKWEIRISNGEIIVEPIELEDKRDHKINKILK